MPDCQHDKTNVIDSRRTADGTVRRRKCLICGDRFTTLEVAIREIRHREKVRDAFLRQTLDEVVRYLREKL